MKIRGLAIALTLLAVALVGGPVAAQTEAPQDGQWSVPRTPSGQPDLQGIWTNNVATPLERPVAFEGKDVLTDEELAELKSQIADVLDGGDAVFGDGLVAAALKENSDYLTFDETTGNYSQVWLVERDVDNRTSLLVDPPDGRLPAYAPAGEVRMAGRAAARLRNAGPEDRDVDERCILGFNSGPPMLPGAYNNLAQVFQVPGYVVILNEMVNDVRVIPEETNTTLKPVLVSISANELSIGEFNQEQTTAAFNRENFVPQLMRGYRRYNPNTHYFVFFFKPSACRMTVPVPTRGGAIDQLELFDTALGYAENLGFKFGYEPIHEEAALIFSNKKPDTSP